MALPPGWKKESNNKFKRDLPSKGGVKLDLITTLDGKQQIVDRESGKVVYERNSDDKNWNTKDKNLDKKITNGDKKVRDNLQITATKESYELINAEGSNDQKSKAKDSKAYKAEANKGLDFTTLQQDALKKEFSGTDKVRESIGGRIQYPIKMHPSQDRIKFTAVEIVPGKKSTYEEKDKPIYIAAQAPIQDTNTVKWGEGTLNPIEKEALSLAQSLISSGSDPGSATADAGKALMEKVTDPSAKATIKEYLAGAAIGKPDVISRTAKKILNPNLELLFQSPALRTMQFSFKMSARDNTEAKAVKAIIKYFKRHMAVRKDTTDLFLKAPHVFTIQYLKGDNQLHKSIGKISPKQSGKTKACALLSCNVDYTPLGSYMTYNDSDATMVSYTINLSFQEIEPIYAEDYDDNHPIGF